MKRSLKIPIAVKVSPFFAAFGNVARQLDAAGADGIVLFNRFYQPDIDTATMKPSPHVELSTSADLLLRLRWLAILHGRVRPTLVVTGGVATPDDGIKALLAGADAVQMVSAILRQGLGISRSCARVSSAGWRWRSLRWLGEVRGRLSTSSLRHPAAVDHANYICSAAPAGRSASHDDSPVGYFPRAAENPRIRCRPALHPQRNLRQSGAGTRLAALTQRGVRMRRPIAACCPDSFLALALFPFPGAPR